MRVVQFSGGITSWAVARRVARANGTKDLVLLFADTQICARSVNDRARFLSDPGATRATPRIEG